MPDTPDFQTLFEASPALYVVLTPDLTVAAATEAYLEATRTRREEIVGRNLFDIFPENPADSGGEQNLRASFEKVLRERTRDVLAVQKYDIRRPDSASDENAFEERYWSLSNTPVLAGDGSSVEYIIHRAEDVTDLMRLTRERSRSAIDSEALRQELVLRAQELLAANQQLQAQEARLTTILDEMPFGVSLADAASGQIIYENRSARDLLRHPLPETSTTEDYVRYGAIHADGTPYAPTDYPLARAVLLGETTLGHEMRYLRGDGDRTWLLVNATPIRDAQNTIVLALCTFTDIAGRKRMEGERAAASRQQRRFMRDVLRSVTEGKLRLCDTADDLPKALPLAAEPVPLRSATLKDLRHVLQDVAARHGFSPERLGDLLTAVGEASMNAVVHAGTGEGEIHANGGGLIQVWVQDHGTGIRIDSLHRATLERGFSSAGTMGHGFWLMLKTCDRLFLLTGPSGTTVVIEQEQVEPSPLWFLGEDRF